MKNTKLNLNDDRCWENMLNVRLANQNCQALVDSGAHISIVSDSMLSKIPSKHIRHVQPKYSTVVGVGGVTHTGTARVFVTVNVGSHCFDQDFHVLDGHHSVILGMDFLTNQQAVIDFPNATITFGGKFTCKLRKHAVRASLARTVKSAFIPAESEMMIQVGLTKSYNNDCLVTDSVTSMEINFPDVKVSCCVVKPKGRSAVIRVINNSNCPIIMAKNTTVAICHRVPEHYVMQIDTVSEDSDSLMLSHANVTQGQCPELDLNLHDADLDSEQKDKLARCIKENRKVFATNMQELGRTDLHYHRIDTGNARPVAQRFYRTSPKLRQEMENQIKELVENGLIEPSTSEWRSPVVMLKKPGNTGYRFAIDYRKVNAVSEKTSFPLPRLDDVWDAIGEANASYFTVLDLASGFWQIPLHAETKHKSSFITQQGQYQWNRLPFGLSNATTTFQMTMSKVFSGLIFKSVLVYVDDIIVYSPTFEKHIEDLENVFARLRQHNLTLKPSKCHFAAKQVDYLGHVISKYGTKPNPSKTAVIDTYPVPKNKTEVRRFNGMSGFYRKYIRDFSSLAHALNNLLKNDSEWEWTEKCENSFKEIKRQLVNAPILAYPDTNKEFILTTDASGQALGYILSQKDNEENERVIAYGGRALRKSERNYPITELEGLAIVEGIKAYHPYIANSHFTIVTDHMALKYLMNVKADTGRIARWALALQGYDYTVIHRKGVANTNADALSRREYDPEKEVETKADTPPFIDMLPVETVRTVFDYDTDEPNKEGYIDPAVQATVTIASLIGGSIGEAQKECKEVGPMYDYLSNNDLPDDDKLARMIVLESDQYGIRDGTLYHIFSPRTKGVLKMDKMINQLVVPVTLRPQILSEYHDSLVGGGHQGFDRTYHAIKSKYYWKGMYAQVDSYVRTCKQCQLSKRSHNSRPAPLHPMPVAAIFQRWHMDFLGPLKKAEGGEQYILLVVDSFSRWCEAFALKDQKATTVATILYEQIFTRYGAPRELISDRGANFMSKLVMALCKLFEVKRHHTSAYHPQTNAACERMNSTIGQALRVYVKDDQSDWPSMLPGIMMAYRMTPAMRSTEFSPYFLVFGREMLTPIDTEMIPPADVPNTHAQHLKQIVENLRLATTLAKENVKHNIERNRKAYDATAKDPDFKIGQTVLLYTPHVQKGLSAKLQIKWKGPYYIVECCQNHTYSLRHANTHVLMKTVVHANRLKPFNESDNAQREEIVDEGDYSEEADTPEDSTNKQSDSDANDHTINRQVDHSINDNVQTDQPQEEQAQNKIERVLRSKRYKGKLWYRVKWFNIRKTEWVDENVVPNDMQREYFVKYTVAGRTKKKRKKLKG